MWGCGETADDDGWMDDGMDGGDEVVRIDGLMMDGRWMDGWMFFFFSVFLHTQDLSPSSSLSSYPFFLTSVFLSFS